MEVGEKMNEERRQEKKRMRKKKRKKTSIEKRKKGKRNGGGVGGTEGCILIHKLPTTSTGKVFRYKSSNFTLNTSKNSFFSAICFSYFRSRFQELLNFVPLLTLLPPKSSPALYLSCLTP